MKNNNMIRIIVVLVLVLRITVCKRKIQYEICEYWVGQSVDFFNGGRDDIKIEIKFKNGCGGIKNLQYWNFTVETEPVINIEKLELECDCVQQNCSKDFRNVNISDNKLYMFKFTAKCFMTACLVCPSRGARLYRRVPVEIQLSTPKPTAPFTEAPGSHGNTLPISIGCLGSVALLFLFLTLLFLHCYQRQRSNQFYVTINSPDKQSGVQTENFGTKPPAKNRKSKIIVVAYPSNQCSRFLDILHLFSENFETFHMLDCAYELTLNFYDWAEKVPTTYDSLLIILDENLLTQDDNSDSYRLKDVLQCFNASLGPERRFDIEIFVITFGHQEELVIKATDSYSYLRTGFVFSISEEELNLNMSRNSSLVELLLRLCGCSSQTRDEKRKYICKTIASAFETQKQQCDLETNYEI